MSDPVWCVTGHRPPKLGGYTAAARKRLEAFAEQELTRIQQGLMPPSKGITGMALGWDMAVATACVKLGIPFVAAIPFKGQEHLWPERSRELYHDLLAKAEDRVIVCPGGYDAEKLQLRNQWMVDHSQAILALWNGSAGGTCNCLRYAKKTKPDAWVEHVWDEWVRFP